MDAAKRQTLADRTSTLLRQTCSGGFDDSTILDSLFDNFSILTWNAGLMEYKMCGMTCMANPPFISERLKRLPGKFHINAFVYL